MVKFAAINNNFTSIKISPFFASKSLYLCINFDIIDFSDTTTRKQINKKKAINIFEAIQLI